MKSKLKENIGYIAIAMVVALTLVLSVVAIDTYQINDIVANAQFEGNGESYADIPIETYDLVYQHNDFYFSYEYGMYFTELDSSFVPQNETLYFIKLSYIDYGSTVDLYAYLYPTNSFILSILPGDSVPLNCIGGSSFVCTPSAALDSVVYPFYILCDDANESFWLLMPDYYGSFSVEDVYDLEFYVVPQSEDNSTTDSFLSLIGDGITFGFESIADGVSYTMDNLFIVDGELTNFSTVLFLTLGIGLALAIVKFVLRFIFSLGGNRKW